MKDIGKMAMFGLMAYVAYEMLVKGQTLSQAFSFIPGLGCVGMYGNNPGVGGIANTSLYGGYATLSSASMSTRAERTLNR